jgi:hypothetical protein
MYLISRFIPAACSQTPNVVQVKHFLDAINKNSKIILLLSKLNQAMPSLKITPLARTYGTLLNNTFALSCALPFYAGNANKAKRATLISFIGSLASFILGSTPLIGPRMFGYAG